MAGRRFRALSLFQQARALGEETGVPASAFYALGRSGIGPGARRSARRAVDELRPRSRRRPRPASSTPEALGDLDALADRLAGQVVEHATRAGRERRSPGLAEVLAAADLPPDTIAQVLRRYQARTGTAAEFWGVLRRGERDRRGIGGRARCATIEAAVRLGELVGTGPAAAAPAARRFDGRGAGRRRKIWRASASTTGANCSRDRARSGARRGARHERGRRPAARTSAQEWIEDRAEAILDTLEEAFPERVHPAARLAESEDIGPAARGAARAGAATRLPPRIDPRARGRRPEAARRARRGRGRERHRGSGGGRARQPRHRPRGRSGRARRHRPALGAGDRRDAAAAVHRRLRRGARRPRAGGARARAGAADGRRQQAGGAPPAAVAAAHARSCSARRRRDIKDMPDARTLFQAAGGFCDCEHCGSVYSPAAYFVDLLRYLNVSSPERLEQSRSGCMDKPHARPRSQASSDGSSRSTCCSAAGPTSPTCRSPARTR